MDDANLRYKVLELKKRVHPKFYLRPKWHLREIYRPYLEVCREYLRYLRDRRVTVKRREVKVDSFYMVPPSAKESEFRRLPVLERYYRDTRGTPNLSLEDFTIHYHYFRDTFTKTPDEIRDDLKALDTDTSNDILDSVFYKDIYVTYMYRIRRRLLIYLKKGILYTEDRVTHSLRRQVEGDPKRYFSLRELKCINAPNVCLIRDRVQFFKQHLEVNYG